MATRKVRPDPDAILRAVEEDGCTGFCIECGEEQGGCEPDARKYRCESCGAFAVYGAEELVLMGFAG